MEYSPRKSTIILLLLLLLPSFFVISDTTMTLERIQLSTPSQTINWLEGWEYRKSHSITGSVGAGIGYQMRVIVHRFAGLDSGEDVYVGTNCQSDFGDIRFTDGDGTTLLDYWLEEATVVRATFWVEVNDNLDTDQTIYIYYSAFSAKTSLSSGYNTFPLFDDFNRADTDLVGGGWFDDSGDGDNDIENNVLKTVQNENEFCHIEMPAPSHSNFVLHGKLRQHAIAPASWKMAVGAYWGSDRWIKVGWRSNDNFEANLFSDSNTDNGALPYLGLDDTWCYYKIEVGTNAIDYYYSLDGEMWTLIHSANRLAGVTGSPLLIIIGKGYENPNTLYPNLDWDNNYATAGPEYTNYADDIFLRKFVDVEPVHEDWGAETMFDEVTQPTTGPSTPGEPLDIDLAMITVFAAGGVAGIALVLGLVTIARTGREVVAPSQPSGYEW
ncbi:MAG: DUF2341 domain-containing protein [Candidatus Thorarchaeota archaeon]